MISRVRTRLPTWVVRIRSVLRFIAALLGHVCVVLPPWPRCPPRNGASDRDSAPHTPQLLRPWSSRVSVQPGISSVCHGDGLGQRCPNVRDVLAHGPLGSGGVTVPERLDDRTVLGE